MKRSTQVLLTLMLPAVAALGCEASKKPHTAKVANCSGPAKPGEPPKTEFCDDPVADQTQSTSNPTANNQNNHTARTGSYFPWIWFWGSGNRSFGGNPGVQSAPRPSTGPMTSGSSSTKGFAPTTRPSGAPSSVSSGGFGGTGRSMSSSS